MVACTMSTATFTSQAAFMEPVLMVWSFAMTPRETSRTFPVGMRLTVQTSAV